MRAIRIVTIAILIASALFAVLSYKLPVPDYVLQANSYITGKANYQSGQALTAFTVGVSLGFVLLFLLGTRQGFSESFKRTYYWIIAGGVLLTCGTLVYGFNVYRGTVETDAATIRGEIPLMAGILVIYWGLYKFARLLQISSLFVTLWFVGFVLVAIAGGLWIAPHKPGVGTNELLFDIANALSGIEAISYAVCAVLAWRIRAVASRQYAPSMMWCAISMVSAFISAALLLSFDFITYPSWLTAGTLSAAFIITNFLTLVWAYSFNKITRMPVRQTSHGNPLIDAITLLASLASQPSEVDPLLEDLRRVTATHEPGKPYTAAETTDLQRVYRSLQEYLVNMERLRSFSANQLDAIVQERYSLRVADAV